MSPAPDLDPPLPEPVAALRRAGQRIWLDDLSLRLISSGALAEAIEDLGVSGVTSNPAILARAIRAGGDYDGPIQARAAAGRVGEDLLLDLAVEDVRAAADLLRPTFEATGGDDGWVSIQLSPRLAEDAAGSVAAASELHERLGRPNILIKIPATPAGLAAIEETIAAGIPVTVTLLLSAADCLAAADAHLRGLERRLESGLRPDVASYAALYVSRWDARVPARAPARLRGMLGIAVARSAYAAMQGFLASPRWQRLVAAGAPAQRLLFASTGARDPALPATHYVERLAAPETANTVPETTLRAFAEGGRVREVVPADGDEAAALLAEFAALGVDLAATGRELQEEAAAAFNEAWEGLVELVGERAPGVGATGR